jgi:hypothetical protein
MEAFETLKKKGKVDPTSLQSLGLDIQIKEDPHAERETAKQDLDAVKARQAKELAQLEE